MVPQASFSRRETHPIVLRVRNFRNSGHILCLTTARQELHIDAGMMFPPSCIGRSDESCSIETTVCRPGPAPSTPAADSTRAECTWNQVRHSRVQSIGLGSRPTTETLAREGSRGFIHRRDV